MLKFFIVVVISFLCVSFLIADNSTNCINDDCDSSEEVDYDYDDYDYSSDSDDNCTSSLWMPVLQIMNTSVDPCDNFYRYACGRFNGLYNDILTSNKMTRFTINDHELMVITRAILDDYSKRNLNPSSAKGKAIAYFNSCIKAKHSANGTALMQQMVNDLGGFWYIDDEDSQKRSEEFDLTSSIINLSRFTGKGIFFWGVAPDPLNSSASSIHLMQGGLGLGSDTRDYYLNKSIETDPILQAYKKLLLDYHSIIIGNSSNKNYTGQFVEESIRLQQKLAEFQVPQNQRNDSVDFNSVSIAWLNENAGFINWTRFFKTQLARVEISIDSSEMIALSSTSYILKLADMLQNVSNTTTGKRTLHNHFVFQAVENYAKYFGESFRRAYSQFSEKFEGTFDMSDLEYFCLKDTDETIGFPLGAMYVEDYFSALDKAHVVKMTEKILTAFRRRVEKAPWMNNETRQFALKKLDSIVYDIGYPDWLLNSTYLDKMYENFTVTDSYAVNQFKAYNFAFTKQLRKLRKVEDVRYEWYFSPQTANAYYAIHQNKFVLPAGLLNFPFYFSGSSYPDALNYGAIGAIISHELSHSIDDQGRQYDEFGHLRSWWDAATSAEFDKRAQCLIDQYNDFGVDGLHVRGSQSIGENIADNGAVRIAFDAYRNDLAEESHGQRVYDLSTCKPINSSDYDSSEQLRLTSDQLFFLAFSQMWCTEYLSMEAFRNSILVDEHPPSPFRVLGALSHFHQFSKAFNCPLGAKMNPAGEICAIW